MRSATLHDIAFFLFGKAVDGWVGRWSSQKMLFCKLRWFFLANYSPTAPPTHAPIFENYCYFLLNNLPTYPPTHCSMITLHAISKKECFFKRRASLKETITALGKVFLKEKCHYIQLPFFYPTHRPIITLHAIPKKESLSWGKHP